MKKGMLFEVVLAMLLIFLSFMLFIMVTTASQSDEWTMSGLTASPHEDNDYTSVQRSNMFIGTDDRLYSIDGKNIHCIDASGHVLWNVAIPDNYTIHMDGKYSNISAINKRWNGMRMVEENGSLFFLIAPDEEDGSGLAGAILAISRDGRLLWDLPYYEMGERPFDKAHGYSMGFPEDLTAMNGRLYVYSTVYETAIAFNGSILWYIDGAANNGLTHRPSIDEAGDLYAMRAGYDVIEYANGSERSNTSTGESLHEKYVSTANDGNGTILGGNGDILQAYYANGTPKWRHDLHEFGADDDLNPPYVLYFDRQPSYHDGLVYVWLPHSVLALDRDGNFKWYKRFGECYINKAWFDGNGSLCVRYAPDLDLINDTASYIKVIGRDGQETAISPQAISNYTRSVRLQIFFYYTRPWDTQVFNNDTVYTMDWVTPLQGKVNLNVTNSTYPYENIKLSYPAVWQHDSVEEHLRENGGKWDFPRSIRDLDTYNISAYDLMTGERRWSYTLPLTGRETVIDEKNAPILLLNPDQAFSDNNLTYEAWYSANDLPQGSKGIGSVSGVNILPGGHVTYVSFWSYNYEVPALFGHSHIVYSGGIYALDPGGALLWSKEPDSRIVSMQEKNGTIYYSTSNGGLSAARVEAMAGFLTAALYLFVRFFLAGTIARARDRLDKSENRNSVLKFITDHPGSGLAEVSKHLKMNKGTARYHLLILCANHRIASYRSDKRYVRYFTNSGSYSNEEQLVLSLMRRESLRRALSMLLKKPGQSNMELSRELGIHTSAASRYLKELVEKGVVSREPAGDGRLSYSIKSEYKGPVAFAVERLGRN